MANQPNRREYLKMLGLSAGALAAPGILPGEAGAEIPASRPTGAGSQVVFQRSIPVRYDVDVFIAGGGPAGVAAALGACSQNRSVFLAEAHSCLGGMGTAARVPVFMQFSDGINFLAGGVGSRVLERFRKESPRSMGGINAEALKRVYDDLVVEAKAQFTFHTNLIGVETTNGRIDHVICSAPSGIFAVRAKVYIDATGNGDLAAWAGAPFEKGDEQGKLMPGTLCSLWANVDWDTVNKNRPKMPQPDGRMLEKAFNDGVFTIRDEHLTGMHRVGENLGGGNIGHTFDVDGTDEVSLTKALVWGRRSLTEFERYYREYLPGFEKTQLVATGSLLGVRETRRIMGDYVLKLEDYKRRAVFEDEIGRYAYPIDNHPVRPGKDTYEQHRKEFDQEMVYKKGESYGIPYRSLIPRKLENVLVAGRCISADRMVHGSVRVMPGCFITGQAAGIGAAMAVEMNITPRAVPVRQLQKRLKAFGAFLPNA